MKTIVLGYKNVDGSGPAEVLAGPEVSRNDAWAILLKAKGQEFPKGFARVEFYVLEQRDMAIQTAKPAAPAAAKPAPEQPTSKSKSK
jgi:hypothetical protein